MVAAKLGSAKRGTKKMIICDKCSKEIKEHQTRKKSRVVAKDKHGKDIEEIFFICPHCKAKYTITYMNEEQRELIKKRKRLHQVYKYSKAVELKKNYMEEEQEILKRQLEIARELKERYKDE